MTIGEGNVKTKDVVGRKIVRVEQQRFFNDHTKSWDVSVDALVLDNGTIISLTACESETEPFVTARLVKRETP